MRRVAQVFLGLVAVLLPGLVVGCGSDGPASAARGPGPTPISSGNPPSTASATVGPPPSATFIGIIDRVKAYTSTDQLAADSDLVVWVDATSTASVVTISGLQFTITDVTVREVLRGAGVPEAVRVRQTGATGAVFRDSPLLAAERSYVLFLEAFELPGEDTAGQYSVVGVAAGMYCQDGDRFVLVDALSPELPARLTLAELRAAAAGS